MHLRRSIVPTVAACRLLGWVAALSVSVPATAGAQSPPEPNDYDTARTVAMGSGARASAMSTSAIATNPAGLTLARLYHVETLAGYRAGDDGWSVGGAAADSVTSKLSAGMSFRGVFNQGQADYDGYDGRLSLAMPLSDRIAIGVSGRYLKLRPDKQDAVDNGLKGFTMGASLSVTPVDDFHIAALAYNFIDHGSALAPVTVGGSASYTISDTFTIAGEGLVDLTTFDSAEVVGGGGIEYLASGSVPLRLGYRYDSGRERHSVTGGLGYIQKKVSVHLSMRKDVAGEAPEGDLRLMFSLRYHAQ